MRMVAGIEKIPSSIASVFGETLSDAAINNTDADVETNQLMHDEILTAVLRNNLVVTVGHSQGNLSLNSVLALSALQYDAIAQVGIAVPDSKLERDLPGVPHITLKENAVIKLARTLPGDILEANFTNNYSLSETYQRSMGHSLARAYLDPGKPAEGYIVNSIDASFFALELELQDAPLNFGSCILVESISCSLFELNLDPTPEILRRWKATGVAIKDSVLRADLLVNPNALTFYTRLQLANVPGLNCHQSVPSTYPPNEINHGCRFDAQTTFEIDTLGAIEDYGDGMTFEIRGQQLWANRREDGLACPGTYTF